MGRSLTLNGLSLVALMICASAVIAQSTPSPQDGTGAAAQPGQPDLVLHETTRRVLVDVVVTDETGKPVHGLTKEDFQVKENGVSQKVLSFDVEDSGKPDFVPPKLPPMPTNTYVNLPSAPERGPLYILVYDMVNTYPEDQATAYKQLMGFFDNKPAGSRFAIYVNTDQLHLVQGFTADQGLLHAAMNFRGPGPHVPGSFLMGGNFGAGDPDKTIALFNFLAQYMEGIPGRKNLIWLSSRMPATLSPDPSHEIPSDPDGAKEALEAMMRSQISIYPVNLSGVVVAEAYTAGDPGGAGGAAGGTGSGGGIAVSHPGSTGFSATAINQSSSDAIAEYTGGHAYYEDNGIAAVMQEAVDHGSNYYTLSYAPSNEKLSYAARKIAVELSKRGYKLSYRQIYYTLPEGAEKSRKKIEIPDDKFLAAKKIDPLFADMEHGAPMMHDLVFAAHVGAAGAPALATPEQMADLQDEPAYFNVRKKIRADHPPLPVKLQKYTVDYTVLDPQLKAYAERTGQPPILEFAAMVYDVNGRLLNGVMNTAQGSLPTAGDGKKPVRFRIQQEIEAPPDAAWVRMAVRDKFSGHTGTLEIPLPLKPETTGAKATQGD